MSESELTKLLEGAAEICEIENFPAQRDACNEAASLIRSQAERIRELEAALEPFDACNFFYKNLPGDTVVSIGRWRVDMGPDEPLQFAADMQANASDFHRARAALGCPNG